MNSESKESWIEVVGNCFGVNQMMCFVVGDHEIPDDAVMLPAYDISNLSPPFPPPSSPNASLISTSPPKTTFEMNSTHQEIVIGTDYAESSSGRHSVGFTRTYCWISILRVYFIIAIYNTSISLLSSTTSITSTTSSPSSNRPFPSALPLSMSNLFSSISSSSWTSLGIPTTSLTPHSALTRAYIIGQSIESHLIGSARGVPEHEEQIRCAEDRRDSARWNRERRVWRLMGRSSVEHFSQTSNERKVRQKIRFD